MLVENLRIVWLSLLGAVVALVAPVPSRAQAASRPSDVIVLVQPTGSSALLSVTFSRKIAHDQARSKVATLAREAGWSLAGVEVDDAEGVAGGAGSQQTGVSAMVTGSPLVSGGGFVLQPFLKAFADANQFELLFMVPNAPAMQPLRNYRSRVVDVTLLRDGSPYRYLFVVKDHGASLPVLPLTEAAASSAHGAGQAGGAVRQLLIVLVLAAGGGLVVFLALRRRTPPSGADKSKSRGAAH